MIGIKDVIITTKISITAIKTTERMIQGIIIQGIIKIITIRMRRSKNN